MFDFIKETPRIEKTLEHNSNIMASGIASTLAPDYIMKSENTLVKNQTIKSGEISAFDSNVKR